MILEWERVVEFFVLGTPKPGGSKRAFYNKAAKRAFIVDACKDNKQWRDSVAAAAMENYDGLVLDEPLRVVMTFYMARPKGHYGTGRNAGKLKDSAPIVPTVKPDVLKLGRSTEDAMTGIIWRDDSSTVSLGLTKVYVAEPGEDGFSNVPGVHISIKRLRQETDDEQRTDDQSE